MEKFKVKLLGKRHTERRWGWANGLMHEVEDEFYVKKGYDEGDHRFCDENGYSYHRKDLEFLDGDDKCSDPSCDAINPAHSELVYLAIPYTWNPERSFEIANKVAAELMLKGSVVFSPISHSHPVAQHMHKDLMTDHELWMKQDLPWLKACGKVVVVNLVNHNGYDLIKSSRGLQRELDVAKEQKMKVEFFNYSE